MGTGIRNAAILAVGIVLGSLRDFLFTNLNYQIDHVRRGTAGSFAHSRFQAVVAGWDLADLIRMKWFLAGTFILCMWGLCMVALWNANALARLARPVSFLFLGIASVSLLMHVMARWLPLEEASVNLLHAIQYPVLLIILLVALMFFPAAHSDRQRPR